MVGTVSPTRALVSSLKRLTNSPMGIPAEPRTGPSCCPGTACPPGICNLSTLTTFLAIIERYNTLNFFNLQEIEFDRRFASEHVDEDLDLAALLIDLGNFAFQLLEWPVDNNDRIILNKINGMG